MRGEQAIFNLEIKKKSGLSINPDIPHSKVFSSVFTALYFYVNNFYTYIITTQDRFIHATNTICFVFKI